MRRSLIIGGLLLGTLLSTGSTIAKEGKFFSAQINYIFSDVEGNGKTGGTGATHFDLERTMGIDPEDDIPEVNLWFHFLRRHSIMLSYFKSSFEGRSVLSDDLTYEGVTYPAMTVIASDFDFAFGRLHYNFRSLDFKVVDFGLIVGVDLYDGEGRVRDENGAVSTQESSFSAPFPVVGINLTIKPPSSPLQIFAEISGTNIDVGDVDANVLDSQVRLTWYFADAPFGISVGYRYLDLELDVDDEGSGSITHEGYYGGLAIRF